MGMIIKLNNEVMHRRLRVRKFQHARRAMDHLASVSGYNA